MTDNHGDARRARMVDEDIARRGVSDPGVLAAMRAVPRHLFTPPAHRGGAYADRPWPIGCGQTISQPYIVAVMVEALEISVTHRVLEIGAGSGYAAAVLAELAAEVHAVERHAALAAAARESLSAAGCARVFVHHADGFQGWPAAAPYDAILVSAAARARPDALLRQLKPGGRLIAPVGPQGAVQTLTLYRRTGHDRWEETPRDLVSFVPLIGGVDFTTTAA